MTMQETGSLWEHFHKVPAHRRSYGFAFGAPRFSRAVLVPLGETLAVLSVGRHCGCGRRRKGLWSAVGFRAAGFLHALIHGSHKFVTGIGGSRLARRPSPSQPCRVPGALAFPAPRRL